MAGSVPAPGDSLCAIETELIAPYGVLLIASINNSNWT
jgi:hypothetical protein